MALKDARRAVADLDRLIADHKKRMQTIRDILARQAGGDQTTALGERPNLSALLTALDNYVPAAS